MLMLSLKRHFINEQLVTYPKPIRFRLYSKYVVVDKHNIESNSKNNNYSFIYDQGTSTVQYARSATIQELVFLFVFRLN